MTTEPNMEGVVFSGCKITCKLGQGGMGSVYKAHQESLDKFVCVKLLFPDLAREQRNVDFFLREARSAAKLEHPNIVHIYNFGQENGSYFIVMSYVEGKSLEALVAEKGPLPVKQATGIIIGVLEGLEHAHSKAIIHRDIKPSNILVTADGLPRIVDFGLARSMSEEKQLTMAGEMVGTAYFMSPEQGLAGKVDNRADLYAAGATYYYILSGSYPFEGKSSMEVIHKHIGEPLPNISLKCPDVPLWAARVIERLMRKKPEDRYQTAAEVIADLRKFSSGETSTGVTSSEKTFDIPEVTARMFAGAPPPPPPQQASSEKHAPQISPGPAAEGQTAEPPPPPPAPKKPALQLAALHNTLKIAMHLALSLAATGCFILAGASGTTQGSLAAPLATNPLTALTLAGAGMVLYVWALWQKPLKFTLLYSSFIFAAALSAYAGGAYLPAPEGADTISKAFLAIKIGLENMFSPANTIVYSLFLYLAASKAAFNRNWLVKGLAVAAYLAGLWLTYAYFKAGADLVPDKAWLSAGGALACLGLAAALTQKDFSLFFNPQFLFLAANLTMFAMFTNPQIEEITRAKIETAAARAAQLNRASQEAYQHVLEASEAEVLYDIDGRPIEKRPPVPPEEIKQTPVGELRGQARIEYYAALARRIRGALAGSAGIIFIALFLALMANACFIEEISAAYLEKNFF